MTQAQQPPALDVDALDLEGLAPGEDRVHQDESITHDQGFLTSWDGTKLFWQCWEASSPQAPRRGRLALMHGYGEHSSRYAHVASAFVRAGWDVMAMDARGHGRSEGRDAHVSLYDEYVLDLERLCDQLEGRWGPERGPLFVYGHSNGGLIALRYALRRPRRVAGFVVTSPMCALNVEVPGWKRGAGEVMSRVWPSFALPTELDPATLTHVRSVVEQYAQDPLVKRIATARWFTEAALAQQDLRERAGRIEHPFLMLIAGSDELVDPLAAEDIYHRMRRAPREIEIYDELYHELLNEHEWASIFRRMLAWLERQRLASSPEPSAPEPSPREEEE